MTPDRLALDLQCALNELAQEKARAQQLLGEIERQNRELDRLRTSIHRESNSRLLAEDALDETRDRLQIAVDAAGLALWDWQLPYRHVFLSARWGELIGDIGRDAYWEVTDLQARVHPDDVPGIKTAMRALLEGREQRAVVQHRVRTATGWMWVETHGMVAEHDPKGEPLRLMGTLADIGERKRIEQDGARARELAEQASRAKSEFLANISHEVRTPLNALMGLTRMLMDSPLSAEQASWLSLMDSSAHSLLNLLNDILDLSRIEAGKLDIEHSRFDLHRTLREAVGPYAEQARAKPLNFQLVLRHDLPQWVMGDPGRLGQVVGNLLSNAIKFTPRNGRIDVMVSYPTSKGQQQPWLQLKVQDSGVGIGRKQQTTIFEAFTQADASTARRYGGSGLGLAICARLAGLMGGSIDLHSELGQGSTFTLTLPLQEAPVDNSGPLSAPMELLEIADAGPRYAGMVVLLAEDHPVNEMMLRQLLLRLGCIVRVARGGAQAVAQWEQGGIDLVLMDVQMPGMSGLQATQLIREAEARRRLKRTPIVAVTANAMPGDRENCLSAGMDGYTPKPVSPQALMREMDRVLEMLASGRTPDMSVEVTTDRTAAPDASQPAASPQALDVEKLRRRLDGDEETLQQLAMAMRSDLASRLEDMERALAARDAAAAVAHAHGLKGSLGSMTAERGARLAKGLELAARAGDWSLFGRALPLMRAEARKIDRILARILNAEGADLFGSTDPPATTY
ncbi:MAG: ATP-binding protein [Hydrogenophaga sp.]|jgi:signal transduction histidine kinase/DNA-binding response OmpR family regulator|uniref:ATP-binding protein n=1 Tax=Hydrogenophaga sp. TaxID=1904254 RepID=UPI0025BCFD68|nr:ATP-binding protein [Hydrogenophaga sp.]MDO9507560.1 ATP-binding protein [Hydrogenophaga sp.]MDP3205463.1 ATP-binding protein [Hydrogenophaga sp.]MDP3628558.1 ATP-binding protein [Hydrogenophaga sp.]